MFKFIKTSNTGIKQQFGKFKKTLEPGLNFYIPFIQNIDIISNKLQLESFSYNVKTKSDAFATLNIAVQYQIQPENSEKAFYNLKQPLKQIDSFIQGILRSKISTMEMNELFKSQDDICHFVSDTLRNRMAQTGYSIMNTTIVEISPDDVIKKAMNQVYASERNREAARNNADAKYVEVVREAEAQKECKRLQGEGTALQRIEMLKGYEQGVNDMCKQFDLNAKDIMNYVVKIQQLEMNSAIATSPNAKVIFMPANSTIATDLMTSLEVTK